MRLRTRCHANVTNLARIHAALALDWNAGQAMPGLKKHLAAVDEPRCSCRHHSYVPHVRSANYLARTSDREPALRRMTEHEGADAPFVPADQRAFGLPVDAQLCHERELAIQARQKWGPKLA
jgi:hypothetical protein